MLSFVGQKEAELADHHSNGGVGTNDFVKDVCSCNKSLMCIVSKMLRKLERASVCNRENRKFPQYGLGIPRISKVMHIIERVLVSISTEVGLRGLRRKKLYRPQCRRTVYRRKLRPSIKPTCLYSKEFKSKWVLLRNPTAAFSVLEFPRGRGTWEASAYR